MSLVEHSPTRLCDDCGVEIARAKEVCAICGDYERYTLQVLHSSDHVLDGLWHDLESFDDLLAAKFLITKYQSHKSYGHLKDRPARPLRVWDNQDCIEVGRTGDANRANRLRAQAEEAERGNLRENLERRLARGLGQPVRGAGQTKDAPK